MDFTRPPLCCCCCGGPHLSGNCETGTYCDLCGKDLLYCSCEPEWVQIPVSYPWMAQPAILDDPESMVTIDTWYPWLAEDWLLVEQPLNQSNQPQEPDLVVIEEFYPWLAQPKVPEEEDLVVIDTWYPWLAEDWLLVEQSQNQSIQPQLEQDDFKVGSQLNEDYEPSDATSDSKQEEQSLIVEESEEIKKKKEKEDKDEIDRVIDFICALFTKVQLKGTWKPYHLFLKFMEFLPNKLKKLDDVLSVSFWPP